MRKIIIGTRGSELALKQAHYTKNLLEKKGFAVEIKIIKTQGDELQKLKPTFLKTDGKGIFTKELEEALLNGEADLAVHSLKDLPVVLPDGLTLGGISEREDPKEVILIKKDSLDPSLKLSIKKSGAVATSSLRRFNQIKFLRPDLEIQPIRGNVPTRIKKFMENPELDAVVLALAGLKRLEIPLETDDYKDIILPSDLMVPAPAQGALGWEIRDNDHELKKILHEITHEETRICAETERMLMHALDAGCHAPLGIFTEKKEETYHVYISYAKEQEKLPVRLALSGENPDDIIQHALKILKNKTGKKIFISKSKDEWPRIYGSLTDAGHQVIMQSLIEFVQIYFGALPEHDAVFFSSPRCVEHYFKLKTSINPTNVYTGCLGEGTQRALIQKGILPDFVGSDTDTAGIMKTFSEKAAGKRILIPVAEKHNPDVENVFCNPELHCILPIYRTVEKPARFHDSFDVVILTSASNASSFFKSRILFHDATRFIAIGEKTKQKIEEYFKGSVKTASGFEELKMLEAIYSVLCKSD
jgi:hydroxymethylbilane synthase